MADLIRVTNGVVAQMLQCAGQDPDRECCGLLAGREGVITKAFPAGNAASEPKTNYEIAPIDLFRLIREIRTAGLELLGIYHSHPNGKNEPSPRDIERAYYPDTAYFILSPRPNAQRPVRAFSIHEGSVTELPVQIT